MFLNSFPFFYYNMHPLIMGSILLIFNILISLNNSIFKNNNWWSYISFLIIVGGLMILFLYFTSFISNMILNLKFLFLKNLLIKYLMMTFFMIMIFKNYNIYMMWNFNYNEINNIKNLLINNNMSEFNFLFMYNINLNFIIPLIYIILILTLIVKMIMFKKFTMRKINFEKINNKKFFNFK